MQEHKLGIHRFEIRAGIYLRVSTREQGEHGTSLDTQREVLLEAATRDGCIVEPGHIWEDMQSGATMRRSGLQEMLVSVSRGEIQRLYFYVQDRLSRDPLDGLLIARECGLAGVDMYTKDGLVDQSEIGQLIQHVRGFGASQERRAILERTQRGKWKTAEDGHWPDGNGRGLYGYDWDLVTKTRVINEEEAYWVRMQFNWALEGLNRNRITKRLRDAGVRTKGGILFHHEAVGRLLRNPAYSGVQFFGTRKTATLPDGRKVTEFRNPSETKRVDTFTPAIITEELFDAVQKKLGVSQPRGKKDGPRYLLTGLVKCASCGGSVVGSMRARGRGYYRCNSTFNYVNRPKSCEERYIRAEQLEPLVWDMVSSAIRDPDILIAEIKKASGDAGGNQQKEIDKLTQQLKELKAKQYRLLQLFGEGFVDQGMLESQLKPIKTMCGEKEATLAGLQEQQRRRDNVGEVEEIVRKYCAQVEEKLDAAGFDEKREVFAAFGVRMEATVDDLSVFMDVDPTVTIDPQLRRGWWRPRWPLRRRRG